MGAVVCTCVEDPGCVTHRDGIDYCAVPHPETGLPLHLDEHHACVCPLKPGSSRILHGSSAMSGVVSYAVLVRPSEDEAVEEAIALDFEEMGDTASESAEATAGPLPAPSAEYDAHFPHEEECPLEPQPTLPMLLRVHRPHNGSPGDDCRHGGAIADVVRVKSGGSHGASGGGSPKEHRLEASNGAEPTAVVDAAGLLRFRVLIARDSAEEFLGLDVRHVQGKLLEVVCISPEGAAAHTKGFKLGDVIHRVNGIGGSCERMIVECAIRADLTFDVVRPSRVGLGASSTLLLEKGRPSVPPLKLPPNPGSPHRSAARQTRPGVIRRWTTNLLR